MQFAPQFRHLTVLHHALQLLQNQQHLLIGISVIKLASGLLFFLPFPCICGGHYITLHYFALLYITWGIFPYFTLHVCALWWQVVISLSRLLCGIQPRWLCGPYHDLLLVWGLLSCHSLSVGTV